MSPNIGFAQKRRFLSDSYRFNNTHACLPFAKSLRCANPSHVTCFHQRISGQTYTTKCETCPCRYAPRPHPTPSNPSPRYQLSQYNGQSLPTKFLEILRNFSENSDTKHNHKKTHATQTGKREKISHQQTRVFHCSKNIFYPPPPPANPPADPTLYCTLLDSSGALEKKPKKRHTDSASLFKTINSGRKVRCDRMYCCRRKKTREYFPCTRTRKNARPYMHTRKKYAWVLFL